MNRAIRVTGFVVTFLSAVALVHGAGVPQIVPPNTPIVALTIDVSSPGSTMEVGQTRSVSGTVTLDTAQTRIVGNGALWSVTFAPAIPVGNCGTGVPVFTSQVIQIDALGAFNNTWSPNAPNTLVGIGSFSMPLATAGATMAATLACGNSAATGSMAASWSGVHYTGTYSFNGVNGAIAVVGITWSSSNPAVATVNPFGQVTAVSPGDAIITGTYGSTCWQTMPDAPASCAGTTVGTTSIHVFSDPSVPTIDAAIEQADAMGFSTDLLTNAQARLLAGNVGAACNQLRAFMQQVAAQSGKSLSEANAAALLSTVAAIRSSLGCG